MPTGDWMARLCAPVDDPGAAPTTMIVAAHPDDEVIGAGGRLPRLKTARFIHVTDGSPRHPADARAAGFTTREGYARARRSELKEALALAGIDPGQCFDLGLIDQEASLHLGDLAPRLAALFGTFRPEVVLTHPYEGGHPDHDAAAFAVHAACRLIERGGAPSPRLAEFTSYHTRNGRMAVFEFLPSKRSEIVTVVLSEETRALKREMMARYATQKKVLARFPVEIERFRPAPRYDFTAPPHPGKLHYESFEWGMTGERWRGLAREAMTHLEIEGRL